MLKWSSVYNLQIATTKKNEKAVVFGHPDIHREFAITLWKGRKMHKKSTYKLELSKTRVFFLVEKNYQLSRYHFIHSCDGELCAEMLIEFHLSCSYYNETDIFIVQSILQFLCLKSKLTANVAFKHYINKHPFIQTTEPPFDWPLLNFTWYLLITIDECKVEAFKALRESYKQGLSRDPTFEQVRFIN